MTAKYHFLKKKEVLEVYKQGRKEALEDELKFLNLGKIKIEGKTEEMEFLIRNRIKELKQKLHSQETKPNTNSLGDSNFMHKIAVKENSLKRRSENKIGSSPDTFNLSEKIIISNKYISNFFYEEDVKEAIKILKERLKKGSSATPTAYDIIDEVFGDKLIEEKKQ